jgi:hypothetical protein
MMQGEALSDSSNSSSSSDASDDDDGGNRVEPMTVLY